MRHGFTIAIETNGTLPVLDTIDWICVSPKAGSELKQTRGHELKLVYPQEGIDPARYLRPRFRASVSAADGRPGARRKHAGGNRLLQSQPGLAAVAANP